MMRSSNPKGETSGRQVSPDVISMRRISVRGLVHLPLLVLVAAGVAFAQQTPRFGQSDVAAIDQLFESYNQAFSARDYAKLKDHLQGPFVGFAPFLGFGNVLTMDGVMDSYRVLREGLDTQEYQRSTLVQRRITALSNDRALVNGVYRRYRRDGSVLVEGALVYLVTKSSGTWKICGILAQDMSEFGKVY